MLLSSRVSPSIDFSPYEPPPGTSLGDPLGPDLTSPGLLGRSSGAEFGAPRIPWEPPGTPVRRVHGSGHFFTAEKWPKCSVYAAD